MLEALHMLTGSKQYVTESIDRGKSIVDCQKVAVYIALNLFSTSWQPQCMHEISCFATNLVTLYCGTHEIRKRFVYSLISLKNDANLSFFSTRLVPLRHQMP